MGRRGNVLAAQAFFVERLHTVVEGSSTTASSATRRSATSRSDGAWNIVPRGVMVQGSLRTFTHALREQALAAPEDLLLRDGQRVRGPLAAATSCTAPCR